MADSDERSCLIQHRAATPSYESVPSAGNITAANADDADYDIAQSIPGTRSMVAVTDYRTNEVDQTEDHDETNTHPPKEVGSLNAKLDSLDYDNCENELYLEEERNRSLMSLRRQHAARWVVMILIGALTGVIASCIDMSVHSLSQLKFGLIGNYYQKAVELEYTMFIPLAIWIAWNVGCVSIASLLTAFGEPVAAGSGIPQIKCFLNGIKIPHVVRIKTLLIKTIGVGLSVTGGLSVGKEGPMIHAGAVVAAGISQGRSTTFGFDLKLFEYFRTDTEKRDFVSGGAASGVSAAFGAPVGGVLFSLEEGASFWNQSLTWRIFLASMVSTFTLNVIMSFYRGVGGQLSYAGLINFEKFPDMTYSAEEIPIFVIMGCIGGLLGAAFNQINYKLTLFRRRNVKRPITQVIEALIVAMSSAMCAFFLIYLDPACQDDHGDDQSSLQMYCPDGQSSSMATLWFRSPEESVKSLFHEDYGRYEPGTLALFFIAYFGLACWTYGLSVPSGLFIPGLVIGAGWGRLLAIGCKSLFKDNAWVNPGKFALIGAAAQLGGIVRMTISLTVILIEATGNISLGLPLIMVLMVAKWTGDYFNEGIYDLHIHLQGVPVLGWEPPPLTSNITAKEVMSHPVSTMQAVEKVSTIVGILKKERHDGFPVVQVDREDMSCYDEFFHQSTFGNLQGVITRSQLIVLLRHRTFVGVDDDESIPKLSLSDFRAIYPRFPRIETVHLAPEDMDRSIDLKPFMNPAPYAVYENASLPRIFKLFRGLGLRHLVVVNRKNEVIGIVTRKDLARYKLFHDHGRYGIHELGMATN